MKRMNGDDEILALKHYKKVDPVLYAVAKKHQGSLTTRITPKRGADALFAALASSVVSQQLSTKAAATIWKRLQVACGGKVTADSLLATSLPDMRAVGLSAAKAKTLIEFSTAVKNGLHLPALRKMPEDEAIQKLVAIWGIGVWTAEMFLIFALGRKDVFSPGDLGLVRAMEDLYGIAPKSPKDMYIARADVWSPYRSYACLVLWRHRDAE